MKYITYAVLVAWIVGPWITSWRLQRQAKRIADALELLATPIDAAPAGQHWEALVRDPDNTNGHC